MRQASNISDRSNPDKHPSRRSFIKRAAGWAGAGILTAGGLTGCGSHGASGRFSNPPGSPEPIAGLGDWVEHISFQVGNGLGIGQEFKPWQGVWERSRALAGLQAHKDRDSITWLGHSAFLLRMDGLSILLDPFLSEYATPFPPFGPRRQTPPGLALKDLPSIDLLLVSHNHYDHLDAPTIEALPGKKNMEVIIPLGLGGFFRERGYSKVRELVWGQAHRAKRIKITALPAIHFSSRGMFDRNQTLWCGFSIASGAKRVYFAGDTAYGPVFKDLGRKHGPFDLALVPIGAYKPRNLMRPYHTNPAEAVRLGRDMKASKLTGAHWGALVLSQEPIDQPPRLFREAGIEAGYDEEDIWIMNIGQTSELG